MDRIMQYINEIKGFMLLSNISALYIAIWLSVGISIYFYIKIDLSMRYILFFLYQIIIFTLEKNSADKSVILLLFIYSMLLLWDDNYHLLIIILNILNMVHLILFLTIFSHVDNIYLFSVYVIIFLSLFINIPMSKKLLLDKISIGLKLYDTNIVINNKHKIIIKELLSKQLNPSFIIDKDGDIKNYNFKYELFSEKINGAHSILKSKWYDLLPKSRSEEWAHIGFTLKNGKNRKYTFSLNINDSKYWFHFEKLSGLDFYICQIYSPIRKDNIFLTKAHNSVLTYIRTHDEISGLYNKAFLVSKIKLLDIPEESINSYYISLFKILDFESVINNKGQAYFNKQLRELAITLENNLKRKDIISRISDDNFSVLLLSDDIEIHNVIDRVFNIFNLYNNLFTISSAYLKIEKKETSEDVFNILFNTINYNVRHHITKPLFFTEAISHKIDIDRTCREILHNKELALVAMPLVRNLNVKGAEILSRVNTTIPLFDFFESINRQGLNDILDTLVFDKCLELIEQLILFDALPNELSINMLPTTLDNDNIIDRFISSFTPYLEKTDIIIEIIEDTFGDKCAIKSITKLKSRGFKIAIDDFGTGYSSLARISKLNIDIVKIDKSLVDDIATISHQCTFLNSLISFLFENNLDVTVEGIENKEQFDSIIEWGKIKCQGFYFSKPIPIEKFIQLMREEIKLLDLMSL